MRFARGNMNAMIRMNTSVKGRSASQIGVLWVFYGCQYRNATGYNVFCSIQTYLHLRVIQFASCETLIDYINYASMTNIYPKDINNVCELEISLKKTICIRC